VLLHGSSSLWVQKRISVRVGNARRPERVAPNESGASAHCTLERTRERTSDDGWGVATGGDPVSSGSVTHNQPQNRSALPLPCCETGLVVGHDLGGAPITPGLFSGASAALSNGAVTLIAAANDVNRISRKSR
jgi:hypothetical protein